MMHADITIIATPNHTLPVTTLKADSGTATLISAAIAAPITRKPHACRKSCTAVTRNASQLR